MNISIGRIVHYVLNAADAEAINRRRTTGESIAERLGGANPMWPTGAQAHIGNSVKEGQEFPAMCVSATLLEGEHGLEAPANFQVFLDGSDTYWATSVKEDQSKKPAPGTWHWPARE